MNQNPRSKYHQPHIRFWCRGQIAVTAKTQIDQTLIINPQDAQAMIEEWILPKPTTNGIEVVKSYTGIKKPSLDGW